MRRSLALGAGVIVAMLLALVGPIAVAVADRPFGSRFSENAQGNITIASNGVLSCVTAEPVCPAARAGTATPASANNNNGRVMTYVDVDTDPATFDSSDATLDLPAGARVLFAGLYYGGRLAGGAGGAPAPNPAARGSVLLQAPGDADYRPLTASQLDTASELYQGFVDVTSVVGAAGAGDYRVANVQVGTGRSDLQSHGWALVVAYSDPAAPSRNLSVFDGFQSVSGSASVNIPLSGFTTPLTGPVRSTVGIVAQEGDPATPGDGASLQPLVGPPVRLSNGLNPATNLFNSTITNNGAAVTSRAPSYPNTLGFDADLFPTTDVLGNGQTSTTVRLTTSGDTYVPGVVTIATELFAPRIVATKTVDQAEADLGDELTYTARFENTGQDGAAGVVATDDLPPNTTYVPGSLAIDGVAQTDAADGDRAEVVGGRVVARLGTGASATAGGLLAAGAASEVTFRAQIADAGPRVGATIENTARADFRAATTGVEDAGVESTPAVTRVRVPELAIVKSHAPEFVAGGTSTFEILVGNLGEAPTSGPITVSDTLSADFTVNGPIVGAGWTCSQASQEITCVRSDPLPAQEVLPPIQIPVQVRVGAQPGQLSNTATVSNATDGNPDNNSVTDAGAVSLPQFDLAVAKRVTSTPGEDLPGYRPGEPITYEIRVTNAGPFPAPDVQLTDPLPVPLNLTTITASQGTCTGTTCALGTINPGEEVVVTLTVSLSGDPARYPSAADVVNRAEVSGAGNEIDPDNNAATATIPTLPIVALSLTKSYAPAAPAAGGPVTYTIEVRNSGPAAADVFIGDILPPALLDPEITIAGGTGECGFGELPEGPGIPLGLCVVPQFEVGGTRTVTLRGTLAPDSAGTTVNNVAATTGSSGEVDFSDNRAEVQFTPGTVDLELEKTLLGDGSVPAGGEATFRLLARSSGTVPASAVTVRDELPDGMTPGAPLPPECTSAGQVITCDAGTLAPGAERAFDVPVRVDAAAAVGTLENRATVSSAEADALPESNVDVAPLAVTPAPPPPPTPDPTGGGAPPTEPQGQTPPSDNATPPTIGTAPGSTVQVATQCQSARRFTIRLRERRARPIRRAEVRIGGKVIEVMRRTSDRRLVAEIDLRGQPRDTYRYEIRARLRDGRLLSYTRSYRTCAKKLPPSNRLPDPGSL